MMPLEIGPGWTPERTETLRTLWKQGVSASGIAKELGHGITRNAVLGKIHRLGAAERGQASAPQARLRGPARPVMRKPERAPTRVYAPAPAAPLPPTVAFDATLTARPWMERAMGQCTWPLGDGLSCCAPVLKRSWCAEHFAIGTQPPKPGNDARGLARSLRRYIA